MLLPTCVTNLLQNCIFCKKFKQRSKESDKDGDNNNKDENRNERTRITNKEDDVIKFKKRKDDKTTKVQTTTHNKNNNNYNSISISNNCEESYVEIDLDKRSRRRRREGNTKEDDDKFSVVKRIQKKDRVSMLKIFRNSLRSSIKEEDVIKEEEEEEEEKEEEKKKGKEEEEEIKDNVKNDGNVKEQKGEIKNVMDGAEFRIRGKEMVDYIVDYLDNVGSKRVLPEVKPGYLRPLLPAQAPHEPEPWDDIMEDVEKKIMPGVLHWNHPHFFAYFASGNSYPTILADMLSDALSMMGFSWASGPVCTELEIIMLDWYGKAIGLPKDFISTTPGSKGGGVIQGSASECILVSMLAARHHALEYLREQERATAEKQKKTKNKDNNNKTKEIKEEDEEEEDEEDIDETGEQSRHLHKLVVYCSKEAHSCVEKAAKICLVKIRVLEPDEKGAMRGDTLRKAMEEDESRGLTPFFVSCIVGSTASCTFDNLVEIGAVCQDRPLVWMHADCAYAGSAFLCPELRPLMSGIEFADSVNTNPNKWMLTCFDCSCLWVKDKLRLTRGMVVDPIYLKHDYDSDLIDFRHWQIPLSRRFRSLKLFFLFRSYGISGLQRYIRNHIQLAKYFETLVRKDLRYEIVNEVKMGLVCFRLKGPDLWTQELLAKINASGRIHMIPGVRRKRYFIRFAVTYEHANDEHIRYAWKVINHYADMVLEKMNVPPATPRPRLSSRQHSFTRGVSRDVYKARSTSLYDGVSPIPVVDDDNDNDDLNNNVFDEAFAAKSV